VAHAEFSYAARLDPLEIWEYIARDSVSAADRCLDGIKAKAALLAERPLMGVGRVDLDTDARSFPAGQYLIFYRPEPFGVFIVRVLHGQRRLRRLLRGH
jgi:toxin ParE1/3/4